MPHPLTGVRVVEIGDRIASAYAGKLLRDAGADVVTLEPPGGSALRRTGAFFDYLSGGKRSAVAADARVTVVPTGAGVLVAQQDGADSVLWMLDPATGDTRWSHDYEVHDGLVGPVVAGDTVSVFAVVHHSPLM